MVYFLLSVLMVYIRDQLSKLHLVFNCKIKKIPAAYRLRFLKIANLIMFFIFYTKPTFAFWRYRRKPWS